MAIAHREHPLAKRRVVAVADIAPDTFVKPLWSDYVAPGAGHRAGDDGDQSGQRAVGLRYHAGLPRSGGAAAGVAAVV
ncbi:hypothetical protein G6F63_016461 [Rhizopus arrhizus]|nr:hypothetical protein G6F63_016461 [Rhizopus arrhizus]